MVSGLQRRVTAAGDLDPEAIGPEGERPVVALAVLELLRVTFNQRLGTLERSRGMAASSSAVVFACACRPPQKRPGQALNGCVAADGYAVGGTVQRL